MEMIRSPSDLLQHAVNARFHVSQILLTSNADPILERAVDAIHLLMDTIVIPSLNNNKYTKTLSRHSSKSPDHPHHGSSLTVPITARAFDSDEGSFTSGDDNNTFTLEPHLSLPVTVINDQASIQSTGSYTIHENAKVPVHPPTSPRRSHSAPNFPSLEAVGVVVLESTEVESPELSVGPSDCRSVKSEPPCRAQAPAPQLCIKAGNTPVSLLVSRVFESCQVHADAVASTCDKPQPSDVVASTYEKSQPLYNKVASSYEVTQPTVTSSYNKPQPSDVVASTYEKSQPLSKKVTSSCEKSPPTVASSHDKSKPTVTSSYDKTQPSNTEASSYGKSQPSDLVATSYGKSQLPSNTMASSYEKSQPSDTIARTYWKPQHAVNNDPGSVTTPKSVEFSPVVSVAPTPTVKPEHAVKYMSRKMVRLVTGKLKPNAQADPSRSSVQFKSRESVLLRESMPRTSQKNRPPSSTLSRRIQLASMNMAVNVQYSTPVPSNSYTSAPLIPPRSVSRNVSISALVNKSWPAPPTTDTNSNASRSTRSSEWSTSSHPLTSIVSTSSLSSEYADPAHPKEMKNRNSVITTETGIMDDDQEAVPDLWPLVELSSERQVALRSKAQELMRQIAGDAIRYYSSNEPRELWAHSKACHVAYLSHHVAPSVHYLHHACMGITLGNLVHALEVLANPRLSVTSASQLPSKPTPQVLERVQRILLGFVAHYTDSQLNHHDPGLPKSNSLSKLVFTQTVFEAAIQQLGPPHPVGVRLVDQITALLVLARLTGLQLLWPTTMEQFHYESMIRAIPQGCSIIPIEDLGVGRQGAGISLPILLPRDAVVTDEGPDPVAEDDHSQSIGMELRKASAHYNRNDRVRQTVFPGLVDVQGRLVAKAWVVIA